MTAVSASLSILSLAAFWVLSRDRTLGWQTVVVSALVCCASVIIAAANLWVPITKGYPNDSFWTLTAAGRIGVLSISTIGISFIFACLTWKTRLTLQIKSQASGSVWALFDIAFGLLIFGVVHTVSPQVFYSFYCLIFDTLPNQWVIDKLFDTVRLQAIAGLAPTGNLADHLAGVVLWAIAPFTIWLHMRDWWRG
jgi:hypothetical protein